MNGNISNKAFLIGNGINRVIPNGVKSWEELLNDIARDFNVSAEVNDFKPFPLAFEEIVFNSSGNFDATLRNIKEKIASKLTHVPHNKYHEQIINSGIKNILTTNYDYAFEKVIFKDFKNEEFLAPRSTFETLNSLRRRTCLKKKSIDKKLSQDELNIWHIHGEINQRLKPSERKNVSYAHSIMIGYEHYGAYLAEIQKYVKGEFDRFNKSTSEQSPKFNSWIDCFFLNELHIAGITFDFSEHHLWWLLNYRAKQIRKEKYRHFYKNSIYYYHHVTSDIFPDEPSIYVQSLLRKKNEKAKLELLRALGVKTVELKIAVNDYASYYEQFLNKALNEQ
jgi:hypothetical protein